MLKVAQEVRMPFKIEVDREEDGRWIAEATDLPGVLAYGSTKDEAIRSVQVLALRVWADRIEHNEAVGTDLFAVA